jgi:transglutaminase superfamily protein
MDSWTLGERSARRELAGAALPHPRGNVFLRAGYVDGSVMARAAMPRRWLRRLLILAVAAAPTLAAQASGRTEGAVLHEPIPADPAEDLAMHVVLDGNLPAAIATPAGNVGAPDPRRLPSSFDHTYSDATDGRWIPDRDTRRPDVAAYDDPFSPSNAPFKRLTVLDAVRDDYTLEVRDPRRVPLSTGLPPDGADDTFYSDLVIQIPDAGPVRIPSVGPDAHPVLTRLAVGARQLPFRLLHDGADNWFVEPMGAVTATRARLVMVLAIARAAFGGPMGDAEWSDLPLVAPLPDRVAREAAVVQNAIGVSRRMRPRDAISKLVQYFRGFAASNEPPHSRGSIYLDLALSRSGVCRHRAFAFLVTAQSLGIPTRMVMNEIHAWVEVHDGSMWRRIDLGGAGHISDLGSAEDRAAYEPAADPFGWPAGSERGDEVVAAARLRRTQPLSPGRPMVATPDDGSSESMSAGARTGNSSGGGGPRSTITLEVTDTDAHRGRPLHVRGTVRAENQTCVNLPVDLSFRDPRTGERWPVGTLATDDAGSFGGALFIPRSTPVGDYDVVAHTLGGSRCGEGGN